jgi:hypothetical protein
LRGILRVMSGPRKSKKVKKLQRLDLHAVLDRAFYTYEPATTRTYSLKAADRLLVGTPQKLQLSRMDSILESKASPGSDSVQP